ncbi:MAG: AAA family ATPase [Bacteroidia bacterium]
MSISPKSNILKAIELLTSEEISYPLDFFDDSEPVEVKLTYTLTNDDHASIRNQLIEKHKFERKTIQKIKINQITFIMKFEPDPEDKEAGFITEIDFKEDLTLYKTDESVRIVDTEKSNEAFEAEKLLSINDYFAQYDDVLLWQYSHIIAFWQSSPKYLIADEIDLLEFSKNPTSISVPLRNCFVLADYSDIEKEIAKLNNAGSIQNLEAKLSDSVTKHINKVWPKHQIKIKFKINNNKLSFLVEDRKVKYKVKTTNQRSDGFKQFVSFLLTMSAENLTEELSNTILLLDEPETHLHPSAQINLKDELIKITQNQNNNIVIYATHSNYMIDKINLDRCYKINKKNNHITELEKIKKSVSSYSEVNYEVFEIVTTDYHNELYGYLEDTDKAKLEGLKKERKWKNMKTNKTEDVSLAKYIRHSIHHPENTANKKFTDEELKQSIEKLRILKVSKKTAVQNGLAGIIQPFSAQLTQA